MGRSRFLSKIGNKRGQVALILIFLAAIALIFYAMSMNVRRLSQSKLQVTIAGNTAVASLASRMASYGEMIMQTNLGGNREKCDTTGVLQALVTLIIIVIIIIISIYCPPAGHALGTFALAMLIVSAVLAFVALVIQIVYIQPKITMMWNKMQAEIETTEDMFLETTLQSGLQQAVSDQVNIRDYYDYNMNSRIAKPGGPFDATDPASWPIVSRFAYYYTERLKRYVNLSAAAAGVFKGDVDDMMRGLGLDKRLDCCDDLPVNKEFCDKNCVPGTVTLFGHQTYWEDPAVLAKCEAGPFPGYPLSYDRLFCNRQDSGSLPGLLGMDDGNIYLRKIDIQSPSSEQTKDLPYNRYIFRGEDSEGYLFPLLWQARDGVPYIKDLPLASVTADSRNCHWCAAGAGGVPACSPATDKATYRYWRYPLDKEPYTQLNLPHFCKGEGCCTNWFVKDPYNFDPDAGGAGAALDTRQIDKVGEFGDYINPNPNKVTILGTTYLSGLVDELPQPPYDCPSIPADQYWRAGADLFCSKTAPYAIGIPPDNLCEKYENMANCTGASYVGGATCTCQDPQCTPAACQRIWFDDKFDDFNVWMKTLATDVYELLGKGITEIAKSVDGWNRTSFDLLNSIDGCGATPQDPCKMCGAVACYDPPNGACSGGIYTMLGDWQAIFQNWWSRDYKGAGLWCLPDDSRLLPANERTFVTSGGLIYGSIESILSCLTYNSDIATKLKDCKDYCDANPAGNNTAPGFKCQNLPRSVLLLPGDTTDPATKHQVDLNALYLYQPGIPPPLGCAQTLPVTINGAVQNLTFREIVDLTYRLALDQAEKFKKRRQFLYNMYEYVRALADSLPALRDAITNPKVQQIKDDICAIILARGQAKIDNVVYYGWCTKPGLKADGVTQDSMCENSGSWHLVRAEAWLPKRCQGYGGCCTDLFPWVKTEKEGAFKRCFYMQDHSGRVRARILRYDPSAGATGKAITFESGLPLWQFRQNNPFASGSAVNLYPCQSSPADPIKKVDTTIAPGAFMINGLKDMDPASLPNHMINPVQCQAAIREALKQSIGNDTCAYYYLDSNNKYNIQFTQCGDDGTKGEGGLCKYDPNDR